MNYIDHTYFYARQFAYDLLRRLFIRKPTNVMMEYLKQQDSFTLFPSHHDAIEIDQSKITLKSYLMTHDFDDDSSDLKTLQNDFDKLFVGVQDTLPLSPPWESVYGCLDNLLSQKNISALKDYYEQYEFQSLDKAETDHIATKLDFLYHLASQNVSLLLSIENSAEQFRKLADFQHQFIQNHVLTFSGLFTKTLHEKADTDFYRALANLLQQFLLLDHHVLDFYLEEAKKVH